MSLRLRLAVCAPFLVAALAAGCKHALENRAIKAFSTALADEDLGNLRKATSPGFAERALRSDEAIDDLDVLDLPTGDTSIVDVEEASDTERNVTVQVGESRNKLLYKLVKDEETGRWVVDDVLTRQRRRGHTDTRSVTELVDLLLSVREFVDAWTDGGRDDVLAVSSPELAAVLGELPPAYLARLTKQVTGEGQKYTTTKPKAQLDGDRAVVELPRSTGDLKLVYRLTEQGWRVTDLALESRGNGEQVPSLLKRATALATAVRFLDAYNAGDKDRLAEVTTPEFFRRGLRAADLSLVTLPRAELAADAYDLTMQAHRADFVLTREGELVKVALVRQNDEDARGLPPVYRVEETVLYEVDGTQEKPLSALFTAHASMLIFAEALRERDLPILRQTATADFNRRVWDRLVDVGIEGFPLDDVSDEPPRVVNTVFQGAVTEITVTQGPRAMTYVLRGRNSDLLVDDLLVPGEGRPASLKAMFELLTPIHLFATGIGTGNVPQVQRSCSDDFNRLVWIQARRIPQPAAEVPAYLAVPPTAVAVAGDLVIVQYGTERRGAKVSLLKERDYYAVDDVQLIAGPEASQRAELKQRLRTTITDGVAANDTRAATPAVAAEPPAVASRDLGPIPESDLGSSSSTTSAGIQMPARPASSNGPPASRPTRRVRKPDPLDLGTLPPVGDVETFTAPVELTPDLGDMPIR